MRQKVKIDLLRKVSDIRRLQRVVAEAELAGADRTLREKVEALNLSETERNTVEESWKDVVCGPLLRLETMALWTDAVARQDRQVQHATTAVDSSVAARNRSVAGLHIAERCSKVASGIARRARKEHRQKLDENAQQDAADRHLQREREP
jgi:hypothetical protein